MIMDIEEIKTKILENKKEHYGKRIGNRTFGGAGEKTVKLCGTVPEDDIYVPYTDIANQRDLDAKNIYAYFFENKDIETVEYSEDFEDEEEKLEEIMGGITFIELEQKFVKPIKIIKTPSYEYHVSEMEGDLFDAWKKKRENNHEIKNEKEDELIKFNHIDFERADI